MTFARLRVALLLVAAAGIGLAWRIPPELWLGPLQAQRHGQMGLVLARAAAFALLVITAPVVGRRGLAIAVTALLASFVWNLAALVFVAHIAWLALTTRGFRGSPSATTARARRRVAATTISAAVVVAVLAGVVAHREEPPALPTTNRELALYWEARDNPFRALPYARAWAASEPAPAEGVLCLARLAHRLGDDDTSRALAGRVVNGAAPEAVRARARSALEALDGGGQ